ncbi:MAG: serine O-acetyltransferase EpsC [Hyphomicrobiaceae bacterium]|nr:serine O-acetyltransferase EpsC [Hyphomicrobiaceae bacterium]
MSWNIDSIVAELREARQRSRRVEIMNSRGALPPSPARLGEVITDIFAALFPRHAGAQVRTVAEVSYFVGHSLNRALCALLEQVRREFAFTSTAPPGETLAASGRTPEMILAAFADALPSIYVLLESDIQAAYDGDPSARSIEEVLLSFPGVRAIFHHRVAHALHGLGAPITARIISELSNSATGIDIHPGARIGASFFIDHGTGVVIGETCRIGDRVRLYQAVTLGAKRFLKDEDGALIKGRERHPIVEDDVVIYAGATILGLLVIGRGSIIGGNVWLTRSVPPGSHVVQAQAQCDVFDQGQRNLTRHRSLRMDANEGFDQ